MKIRPDEIALFMQAVTSTSRKAREAVLKKLPIQKELLETAWSLDRGAWSDDEVLAFYECFVSSLEWDNSRMGEIAGDIFARLKQGRLKSLELFNAANYVAGNIRNEMFHRRGGEDVKIPLVLQIIDERPPDLRLAGLYSSAMVSLVANTDAQWLIANPEMLRALVTKGRDHPNADVAKQIRDLAANVAAVNPRFSDLL
jgi:hypothetical protein